MLTTLSLFVQDPMMMEFYVTTETYAELTRSGGDISQPLTVYLTSSDESEATVPESVTIPADETTVHFPITAVDDNALDGDQIAVITATADDATTYDWVLVRDFETVTFTLDQSSLSPGDVLTGTLTTSVSEHTESVFFSLVSSRPEEIASILVEVPVGQQFGTFAIPVVTDAVIEGPHNVSLEVSSIGGFIGDWKHVTVSGGDVTTLQPVDDGSARDTDMDGAVFETVATHFHSITNQAASPSGAFGESRGILEFDTAAIPVGAIIQSAVLTLEIDGASYPFGTNPVMDIFAYGGNGGVESDDANQITTHVGQVTVPTDDGYTLGSFGIVVDVPAIQALVDGGDYLGFTSKMLAGYLSYHSSEFFRTVSRPSLHLVLANPPVITTNSLTVSEGETVTLSTATLAATDADAGELLVFSVSDVSGGQFFVAGTPATTFTQAEVIAGEVAFVHDGGEIAPSYSVSVSDGAYQDGPSAASITFSNLNDNAPAILGGQSFSVSEAAQNGAFVGTVSFGDADLPGDSLAATIAAGNTGGAFSIDNAGTLTVANSAQLDFESTTSYTLTISISDGVHASNQTITINVLDVAETKFYVVDDGSANRNYEYTATGATIENYALNSANSAPRGAASTVAGDRVWVIDANRKVYVYNTSGGLIGSWTAGTLASSAVVEGIANNGTDIWIVDTNTDKVFKFAGAASRTSGNQNAASSFNLNSSNKNPKDIVTDGASLWVVNSTSTDKVFKYSIAGSLQGSWTIDSANSSPTGITIDPANVSNIWIVDSSTDRIYQYNGAASRTSGSQSAAVSYALAAANTNPQGIADPPSPSAHLQEKTQAFRETQAAIRGSIFDAWLPPRRETQLKRVISEPIVPSSQVPKLEHPRRFASQISDAAIESVFESFNSNDESEFCDDLGKPRVRQKFDRQIGPQVESEFNESASQRRREFEPVPG